MRNAEDKSVTVGPSVLQPQVGQSGESTLTGGDCNAAVVRFYRMLFGTLQPYFSRLRSFWNMIRGVEACSNEGRAGEVTAQVTYNHARVRHASRAVINGRTRRVSGVEHIALVVS